MDVTSRVLATSSTGMFPWVRFTFTVLLPAGLIWLGVWASSHATDTTPVENMIAFAILGLISALMIALGFMRAKIIVRDDCVELRMTRFYVRQLPLDRITEVTSTRLNFWRYSLGWRLYGSGEMGLVPRNGTGLHIKILPAGGYYISVADEATAERIIEAIDSAQTAR